METEYLPVEFYYETLNLSLEKVTNLLLIKGGQDAVPVELNAKLVLQAYNYAYDNHICVSDALKDFFYSHDKTGFTIINPVFNKMLVIAIVQQIREIAFSLKRIKEISNYS